MPPHPVLVDSKVLHNIFEHFRLNDHLSPKSVEITPKQDLLKASLTCRAFCEPALDVLWRTLDSLVPLVRLLPSLELERGVYTLYRTIENDGWARFDHYARRVKEFVYHQPNQYARVDPSVYFYIAQSRSLPLLPMLNRLRCSSSALSILLFPSASLRRLEITTRRTNSQQEPTLRLFLSVLMTVATSLKYLSIDGQLETCSIAPIAQLKHLTSLKLWGTGHSIDAAVLRQLGALERLSSLTIDLNNSRISSADTHPLRGGFKALEKLEISGVLATINGVLAKISTDRLVSISIAAQRSDISSFGFISNTDPSAWMSLFEIVGSRWPDTLRVLMITCPSPDIGPNYYGGLLTIFEPLRALTQLEYLRVENIPCMQSDEDVRALASAWPAIRTLCIPIDPHHPCTVSALHSVAELCPRLRYLQMSINTENLPPFSATPVLSHSLETLVLGHSAVADPSLLARHLDRLFPALVTIRSADPANDLCEVENLVRMCQDVRFYAREQMSEKV